MVVVTANMGDPLLFTIGFLTKDPNQFECNTDEQGWRPCTKAEICGEGLSPDQYRPVKDDPEYVDNWTSADKMNLLCEDKQKIGL